MKNSRKNIVMAVALTLLGVAQFSYAQSIIPESAEINEFKLNGNIAVEEKILNTNKEIANEYKLSLGSQMLNYQNPSRVYPSEAKHIETGFKGLTTTDSVEEVIVKDTPVFEIGSVITLNNSYEDNSIGYNDSSITGISFTTKTGRFDLRGSYSQSNMPMSLASSEPSASGSEVAASARASMGSELSPSTSSPKESVEASLASDYYLEAVYNFKPTLKGKVAFKKSMIDTFDSKENVEVEGIVDATSDVSIKAGYSEENRSEVETKNSREKKVWTEFILKF